MKTLLSAFAALVFVAIPLSAKIVQVSGENITIDVPDTWVAANLSQPEYIYSAAEPDHRAAVALAKLPNPKAHGITPSYIAGTKKGMIDAAAKAGATTEVKSENSLTIDGVPAYVFTTETSLAGKKVEGANYVIATHDFYYLFTVQTTDAGKMPDMQAMANTFHFTTAPALPDSGSADFEAGERAGSFFVYGGALLVLIIVVRIIVRKSRQSTSSR